MLSHMIQHSGVTGGWLALAGIGMAVVAYFQPVTRAYVEQVRGVDSSYTVGLLLDRELIEECGRLAVPGRPILYRTTPTFLRSFGLSSLEELPELPAAAPEEGQLSLDMQNALEKLRDLREEGEEPTEEESSAPEGSGGASGEEETEEPEIEKDPLKSCLPGYAE